MSNESDIYNEDTGMLSISSDEMEAEFRMATRQAVENMDLDFDFHGYTIETAVAIDVVQGILAHRTYH